MEIENDEIAFEKSKKKDFYEKKTNKQRWRYLRNKYLMCT